MDSMDSPSEQDFPADRQFLLMDIHPIQIKRKRTMGTSIMTRFWIAICVFGLLGGCSRIPACDNFYSNQGYDTSLRTLTAEFQRAVEVAKERSNTALLVEAREIGTSRYYGSMEEFSCKVQTLYGRF